MRRDEAALILKKLDEESMNPEEKKSYCDSLYDLFISTIAGDILNSAQILDASIGNVKEDKIWIYHG